MGLQEQRYKLDLQILNKGETMALFIKGYGAAIERKPSGHLCGYVEVSREIDENDIVCHGGATFCGPIMDFFPAFKRWIGFDCAHHGDWTPTHREGIYRDVRFVIKELRDVIAQLEEMGEEK